MGKNNLMPRLCGVVIALILSIVVFRTTWHYGLIYENRIQGTTVLILFFWGALLLKAKGWCYYNKVELAAAVILFVGLGLFMGFAWSRLGLTTPLVGINAANEGIHRDSLYHNAIASSIEYYGCPSLLVNSGAFHNYHFGSHMIFGFISMILEMPTIFTYSYIYPMLFFPLYPSLVLTVVRGIRKFFSANEKETVLDIVVLMSFMTYLILPQGWSDQMANWKTSWLQSESFCVANVLGLLYFSIWLNISTEQIFKNKIFQGFFSLIVTPLFIISISLSKISVGIVFAFVIAYLLSRQKGMNYRYLLLELLYIGIPFLLHYALSMVYSPFGSGTIEAIKLYPFHYLRKYVERQAYGLHLLVFFAFAFVFLVFRLRNAMTFKTLWEGIVQKKYLVEEMLFFVCILVSLPGAMFAIGGGSAFYFVAIEQLIAVVLLIGYNIPNEIFSRLYSFYEFNIKRNCIYKVAAIIMLVCVSFNFFVSSSYYAKRLWKDCRYNKDQYAESVKENSYWSVIDRINKISEGHKEDYYIYVCPSANVWKKFENPDSALFFYPAMTGIVCIGELYFENGELYTNNGKPKHSGYPYKPLSEEPRLTEEGAYQKAEEDGKKAIIYIYDDSMSVVEIES